MNNLPLRELNFLFVELGIKFAMVNADQRRVEGDGLVDVRVQIKVDGVHLDATVHVVCPLCDVVGVVHCQVEGSRLEEHLDLAGADF